MPNHKLTNHARDRIDERTFVDEEMVLMALDNGLYLPLGREAGTNRSHELLYIKCEEEWFVVVRDVVTEEVITFLPADYHNRWRISFQALQQAKSIALSENPSVYVPNELNLRSPEDLGGPKVYKLSVIVSLESEETKIHGLGSWPINGRVQIEDLLTDQEFLFEMRNRINVKSIKPDKILAFFVKTGNRGPAVKLSVLSALAEPT